MTNVVSALILTGNLLINPLLEFHSFDNYRLGKSASYYASTVAFWNTETPQDVTVVRTSHVNKKVMTANGCLLI